MMSENKRKSFTKTYSRPEMEVVKIKMPDVICVSISFDDFFGSIVDTLDEWSKDI